jgi:hypothetical protein
MPWWCTAFGAGCQNRWIKEATAVRVVEAGLQRFRPDAGSRVSAKGSADPAGTGSKAGPDTGRTRVPTAATLRGRTASVGHRLHAGCRNAVPEKMYLIAVIDIRPASCLRDSCPPIARSVTCGCFGIHRTLRRATGGIYGQSGPVSAHAAAGMERGRAGAKARAAWACIP